jgi:hypothetical protein
MLAFAAKIFAIAAFAAVVAFLGFVLWSALFPAHHPIENAASRDEQYPQEQRSEERPPIIQAESATNKKIANYTFALAVFTALLVLVAIFQIAYLIQADKIAKQSADAAQRSASVAQNALIATNRPWIKVVDITADAGMYVTKGGAGLNLWFHLKNIGHSPAKNVRLHVDGRVQGGHGETILEYERRICREARLSKNEEATHILFPGDPLVLQRKPGGFNAAPGGGVSPEIVGCVTYEFDFSERIHMTAFAFTVMTGQDTLTSTSRGSVIAPTDDRSFTIAPADLKFDHPANSDFAD